MSEGTNSSRRLPIFPLGTVAVPGVGLPLHVFEPRYRTLMAELTGGADGAATAGRQFGIVLIRRGSEVGGGDERFSVGTMVSVLAHEELPDGRWAAIVGGDRRFQVRRWLPDDPYPQAVVEPLLDAPWDSGDDAALLEAARQVRRALSMAVELGDSAGPVTVAAVDDPVETLWRLCAVAPVGAFDRQQLLEAPSPARRLALLAEMVRHSAEVLAFRLSGA